MAIKGGKKNGKARCAPKKKRKTTKTTPARKRKPAPEEAGSGSGSAEEQFIRGVLIRGEAAAPDEKGELPPGATHVVEETEEGEREIVRDRFSLY